MASAADASGNTVDLSERKALMRYNRLLRMQERQSSALASLATRMRLRPTNRATRRTRRLLRRARRAV